MRLLPILLTAAIAATLAPPARGQFAAAPPAGQWAAAGQTSPAAPWSSASPSRPVIRRLPPAAAEAAPTYVAQRQPGGARGPYGSAVGDQDLPLSGPYYLPPPSDGSNFDDGDGSLRLEDLAWQKKGLRVVPYGAVWGDAVYATQRTNPGAFTLWVFSRQSQPEDAFAIDARRSRFGLDVETRPLAALGGAVSRGRIEIDFFGDFVTENRANLRLRHAYWEIESDTYSILFGQTWDVVSPLLPHTLNLGSGWDAGNIGFRRTQLRGERYWNVSDVSRVTLQAALSQNIVTDFPTDVGVRRESTNWPTIEGRLAWTLGPRDATRAPATLGLSGHIGETGFDFLAPGPPPVNLPPVSNARFPTWSANLDLYLPLTARLGFQGEVFTGANLGAYFGGVGQGVCSCLRAPIHSRGGWGEFWYQWTPRLQTAAGYGLDDPRDSDLLFGRTYNQFFFANFLVDVTDQLSTGLEISCWTTLYQDQRVGLIPASQLIPTAPGKAVVFDWMTKFQF